jgi:formate hydrogenlyase subunit 6/NADH:ubiquinone oxidoreductase subunit I
MRLGLLLGDLLGSLVRAPATRAYPASRQAAPRRLRGPVVFDRLRCTGCRVCVMDCPASALELFTLDKASKRFVMDYHLDRCTFCAQCVESCKQHALGLSNTDWELAAPARSSLTRHYGEPEDVQQVLAERRSASAAAGPAA